MNIFEIHEKTGINMRALAKLDKMKLLVVDKTFPGVLIKARENLAKGNPLSAVQILNIVRADPKDLKPLERWKYELADLVEELGDIGAEGAPWTGVAVRIDAAASKDPKAVEAIALWFRELINRSENFDKGKMQRHAFLAVRLMANVPEHHIDTLSEKLTACMWQCRNHAVLKGYWFVDAKKKTLYRRPEKLASLDL